MFNVVATKQKENHVNQEYPFRFISNFCSVISLFAGYDIEIWFMEVQIYFEIVL
jgi:hypothetical protein